jgi:hypothetical protein
MGRDSSAHMVAGAEELWLTGPPARAVNTNPSAMQDQNGHCRCCALINTLKHHALNKDPVPACCPMGPGQTRPDAQSGQKVDEACRTGMLVVRIA